MAIVVGTNSGFVAVAPTANPVGTSTSFGDRADVTNDTSPADATRITEVGWWADTATEEANYEVGLYAADGTGGIAGTLLFVSRTNAKGTTSGWKRATVDWSISPSTVYWIGVQADATATEIRTDASNVNGAGRDFLDGTTLPDPYGGGTPFDADGMYAFYAVWEAAASGPANLKTYNTNPVANTKTINTNPIANVKTLNTNA